MEKKERKALTIEFFEEKPKEPIIIEGFPGFGFVSTIVTEYLIKHLDAKPIGRIVSDKLLPIAAIHKANIIYPLEIFYDKKTNIMIVQAVTPVEGMEWRLADAIIELAKEVNAKEVISLEGVASTREIAKHEVFFYSNSEERKNALEGINIKPLEEGIILGVTGALLLKAREITLSCLFVETQAEIPDNRAAAELVKILDKYLNLTIDYKPLIKQAEAVEAKLKSLISNLNKIKQLKEKKKLTYIT